MKTILVDDEPMAIQVLENMLSSYKDINIIGRYTKASKALESLKVVEPDIIFLDIEMGEMNGLELAEIFMEKLDNVEIVFVTAYSEYAVDAFEINAIDYLSKPIQEKRLLKAIERLRENIKGSQIENKNKDILDNRLKVQSFGGFQVIDHMDKSLKWRTQKSKELFAYLWEKKDGAVSKDLIIEELFPDRDLEKASTLLHTTIYQLRKNLRDLGYKNGVIYFDDSYQLNLPIESDFEEFKKIVGSKMYNDENTRALLEIYIGDFLEEGYHWAINVQQICRQALVNWIIKFANIEIKEGRNNLLLKIALDKAYEMDSFNEVLAEMIIHYYGMDNNKGKLEDFFNNHVEELHKEMSLKPGGSILNIYNRYMKA